MTVMAPDEVFTPDDVIALEEEGLYELVDGKLVEKLMSSISTKTTAFVVVALSNHLRPQQLGDVFVEQSFQCFSGERDRIRRPDVAVILAERSETLGDEGHIKMPPDIVVEVVSPSDKIYELDQKLDDYRSAGIKLVWVVNPDSRTIRVHRPDHSVSEFVDGDTLTGESVLPGFAAKIEELLPPKRKA